MALAGATSGDHSRCRRRDYDGPDGSREVAAPAVEAVDTTGAGDVFAGVLAAEWLAGPLDALRRACAAGALATLVPGAGDCAPSAEAIDDVLDDARVASSQVLGRSTSWAIAMPAPDSRSLGVWFNRTRLRLGDNTIDKK